MPNYRSLTGNPIRVQNYKKYNCQWRHWKSDQTYRREYVSARRKRSQINAFIYNDDVGLNRNERRDDIRGDHFNNGKIARIPISLTNSDVLRIVENYCLKISLVPITAVVFGQSATVDQSSNLGPVTGHLTHY